MTFISHCDTIDLHGEAVVQVPLLALECTLGVPFCDMILDVERRELRSGAKLITVEPQVFDILVFLIWNCDRVVGKDDLLTAVWDGRMVSEFRDCSSDQCRPARGR